MLSLAVAAVLAFQDRPLLLDDTPEYQKHLRAIPKDRPFAVTFKINSAIAAVPREMKLTVDGPRFIYEEPRTETLWDGHAATIINRITGKVTHTDQKPSDGWFEILGVIDYHYPTPAEARLPPFLHRLTREVFKTRPISRTDPQATEVGWSIDRGGGDDLTLYDLWFDSATGLIHELSATGYGMSTSFSYTYRINWDTNVKLDSDFFALANLRRLAVLNYRESPKYRFVPDVALPDGLGRLIIHAPRISGSKYVVATQQGHVEFSWPSGDGSVQLPDSYYRLAFGDHATAIPVHDGFDTVVEFGRLKAPKGSDVVIFERDPRVDSYPTLTIDAGKTEPTFAGTWFVRMNGKVRRVQIKPLQMLRY